VELHIRPIVPVAEFCMDRAGEKIRKDSRIISNDQKPLKPSSQIRSMNFAGPKNNGRHLIEKRR
jgi:hypothetical protein